jgi:hypothetical protein
MSAGLVQTMMGRWEGMSRAEALGHVRQAQEYASRHGLAIPRANLVDQADNTLYLSELRDEEKAGSPVKFEGFVTPTKGGAKAKNPLARYHRELKKYKALHPRMSHKQAVQSFKKVYAKMK